jgi:hypothetical protein
VLYFLAIAPIWQAYFRKEISMQKRDQMLGYHRAYMNTPLLPIRSSNADLA